jgi:nitric oxide reductase subunit C
VGTQSGIRTFFFLCVAVASILVTLPMLLFMPVTSAEAEPQVQRGFGVWRASGCETCHNLVGDGGLYAADLTHVATRYPEAQLREVVQHRALMRETGFTRSFPTLGLTQTETDALIAFLRDVASRADQVPPFLAFAAQGDRAAAAAAAPTPAAALPGETAPTLPPRDGRALFSSAPGNCATCHSLEPGVVLVGPSLAGVAGRAGARVAGQSAEAYLRTSIVHPDRFIVPGFANAMPANLGSQLSSDEVNALVAFLLTLN